MARRKGDNSETEAHAPLRRRAVVYKPCAVCGRAVQLWDETRVQEDPETYECPHCGARFYLTPPDGC
jgi:DNA-directed RNA polymerase subunit RPC12/RpoP